jgi:translation elongation factor EF-Tu-like GTPase
MDREFINVSNMKNEDLIFLVDEGFYITGRGRILAGQVIQGKIEIGDKLTLVKINRKVMLKIDEYEVTVKGIEGFRKSNLKIANEGDNVGVYIEGVETFKPAKGNLLVSGNWEELIGLETL